MKLATAFIIYLCNIICSLKFKVEECGVYEEYMDGSDVNLRKGVFEIELDSIRFQNEEFVSLKTFSKSHGVLLASGVCSSELFKNTLALNDTTVSRNLTRTFKLIINGTPCNEKHLMISEVKLSEAQSNKIIFSSEIKEVGWDKDNKEITKQCVDFINSFLEDNGKNPHFIKLREMYGINYNCKFVCSMNMMKRCVKKSDKGGSGAQSFFNNLNECLKEDLKKMREINFTGFSSLSFIEVFDNMGILLRQITKVENFPYLSRILLKNSRNGEIQIYRSISVKLEDLPAGRSLGDYEICFYDESKKKISKKFDFHTSEYKTFLLFTQLVDNGVKFLGVHLKNEEEDIIFYDLKEHLQVQSQEELSISN